MNRQARSEHGNPHGLQKPESGVELSARNHQTPDVERVRYSPQAQALVSIVGFRAASVLNALPSECFVG